MVNLTEISVVYGYVTWRMTTEITVLYGSEGFNAYLRYVLMASMRIAEFHVLHFSKSSVLPKWMNTDKE